VVNRLFWRLVIYVMQHGVLYSQQVLAGCKRPNLYSSRYSHFRYTVNHQRICFC